ncbi:aldehyde oxidase GLOX-like [Rutidosis leptorrhynchoides]|uniref:aldehyde oxidase GLOX-like n=1 Tax=Rutidosis leptorrhynchoides TaxID=125765 RepID=UPI003A9A2FA1
MKQSRLFLLLLIIWVVLKESRSDLPGTWELLVSNARIASMHTAVTRFSTVVLLDRTDLSPTEERNDRYHCRKHTLDDPSATQDCYAYSVLYDLSNNYLLPLMVVTDTWCSSGQFLPDGTLLQTGGDNDGFKKIRRFKPCENRLCDWEELENIELAEGRWYSSNQILPNGSVIIVGGRDAVGVELFPQQNGPRVVNFPFLEEAKDDQVDNLYPYVHLLPNGHLFVFANNKSVLYDYTNNVVLKRYPELEGGPRNYPSAGSSVILALTRDYSSATIVVCGGAEYRAFKENKTGAPAQKSCGRIEATAKDPVWEMEDMPFGRIMGDMVMLPTGDVLIVNGAQAGSQGFEMASKPCLNPVLYKPNEPLRLRFVTQNPGSVPRMYHSTANLLPDGRVLLAGSNPHSYYNFSTEFPTELKIEAFSPEYLSPEKKIMRPTIIGLPEKIHYGGRFDILVMSGFPMAVVPEVNIASAPFATHSFSQGQRLVKLMVSSAISGFLGEYRFECKAPPNGKVAPPGYYMLFVVNMGVPSVARWVQLA